MVNLLLPAASGALDTLPQEVGHWMVGCPCQYMRPKWAEQACKGSALIHREGLNLAIPVPIDELAYNPGMTCTDLAVSASVAPAL